MKEMPVFPLKNKSPQIDESAFVSDHASIIGDVKIGPNCSIWPGSILRGDSAPIILNECVHVQDAVIIHAHQKNAPIEISSYTTIESTASVYGAFLGEAIVVGAGSMIFDNVTISEGVLLAPDSYVPAGMVIQPRVVMKSDGPGIPVATVRKMSMEEVTAQRDRAERYAETFQKLGRWMK